MHVCVGAYTLSHSTDDCYLILSRTVSPSWKRSMTGSLPSKRPRWRHCRTQTAASASRRQQNANCACAWKRCSFRTTNSRAWWTTSAVSQRECVCFVWGCGVWGGCFSLSLSLSVHTPRTHHKPKYTHVPCVSALACALTAGDCRRPSLSSGVNWCSSSSNSSLQCPPPPHHTRTHMRTRFHSQTLLPLCARSSSPAAAAWARACGLHG